MPAGSRDPRPRPAALGVLLEGAELLGPERLDLVEPGLQRDESIGSQPVDAAPGVVRERLDLDEPAVAQHPEVPAQRRSRHRNRVGQLARPAGLGAEQLDDPSPGGIGQRRERGVEIVYDSVNY